MYILLYCRTLSCCYQVTNSSPLPTDQRLWFLKEALGIQSEAKWNVVTVWPLIKSFQRGGFTVLKGEKNEYIVFSHPLRPVIHKAFMLLQTVRTDEDSCLSDS